MNIRLFPLNIKEYGIASLEIDLGNNIEPYIWLYKSWTYDNYESKVKPSLFQFIFNISLKGFNKRVYYASYCNISMYMPIISRFIGLNISVIYLNVN